MFLNLSRDEDVYEKMNSVSHRPFILWKACQASKTGEVFKILSDSEWHKTSAVIFVSDKNTSLAGQTNLRARNLGWKVEDYKSGNLATFIREGVGKKRIAHFLMEVNNVDNLYLLLLSLDDLPVTIIVDEGDKNRNTELAGKKKQAFDGEDDAADSNDLPPITKTLLKIKNLVVERANSRIIFMTATPQGLLCSEKNDWVVIYKEPYKNYCGIALDKEDTNIDVIHCIREMQCKTGSRWTDNNQDKWYNSYRPAVTQIITDFIDLKSKDASVKQLCLLSIEHQNASQTRLKNFVETLLTSTDAKSVGVIVFNSIEKETDDTLADMIKRAPQDKLVIISGFMASRGVSFTDFSDQFNKFELVSQLHYTKDTQPLNSCLQAMRIQGPARRTVTRPILYTNHLGYMDMKYNFLEGYRICRDIAEGSIPVARGKYDSNRLFTQAFNFRYLKRSYGSQFLVVSSSETDLLPII